MENIGWIARNSNNRKQRGQVQTVYKKYNNFSCIDHGPFKVIQAPKAWYR